MLASTAPRHQMSHGPDYIPQSKSHSAISCFSNSAPVCCTRRAAFRHQKFPRIATVSPNFSHIPSLQSRTDLSSKSFAMEKSLLCAESSADRVAAKDDVILDDRVMEHLLQTECRYMAGEEYFRKNDLDPACRKIVTKWMLEVCEEENCPPPILPMAVNYFDRFLCQCNVPKKFLQLVASDCLLIASKLRQSSPMSIHSLCYHTDNSVTPSQIRNFELLITSKLKWDLAAVTGFDFIDQIIQRVTWCNVRQENTIRTHAITLIQFCCTEVDFYHLKPSVLAVACTVSAMRGIHVSVDLERMKKLCAMVKCSSEVVESVVSTVEKLVSDEISRLDQRANSKLIQHYYQLNVAMLVPVKCKKNMNTLVDGQNVES